MKGWIVPGGVLAVLVGLYLMLPQRAAETADVHRLPGLPPLPVSEPPPWAIARGADEIERNLDRIDWGMPETLAAAREELAAHPERLAPRLLDRLDGLGEGDIVLASKYVELLGGVDLEADGVLEALVEAAHSPHAIVAKAALRILARHPDPRALEGIYPRLTDRDLTVRSVARAALASRARRGDPDCQTIVLEELERNPAEPDLAYVVALDRVVDEERARAVLREVREQAHHEARLVALAALLRLGDEPAREVFETMVAGNDPQERANALRLAVEAGVVLGRDEWSRILMIQDRADTFPLLAMLALALERGGEAGVEAMALLETAALDSSHLAREEATGLLLERHHPLALERTRIELEQAVGTQLGVVVDRVIRSGGDPSRWAPIAWLRLEDPALSDPDRVTLLRLLSHVDPDGSADVVVRHALLDDGVSSYVADQVVGFLTRLGSRGLELLAARRDEPRGAALFVYVAGTLGDPAALERLTGLALDEAAEPAVRLAAMDAIARLDGGEREDALRRIAKATDDEAIRERARLLVWNYL